MDYCINTEQSGTLLTFFKGQDLMCGLLNTRTFTVTRDNILAAKKCVDINMNDKDIIFNKEADGRITSGSGKGSMKAWNNDNPNASAVIQFNNGDAGYNKECKVEGDGKINCNFGSSKIGVSLSGDLLVAYYQAQSETFAFTPLQ